MAMMASAPYLALESVRRHIDRFALPIILILGNGTNLANIYLFSRRNLRAYPCSWYFICLSVVHLLLLDNHCLSRAIIAWTGYDLAKDRPVYCKIRSYLFTLSMILSRQFICLISMDRWLVTSSIAWLRNQSSLKMTRILIFSSVLFWSVYDIHALIGFQSNSTGCHPLPFSTYSSFAALDTIITTVLPLVIMVIFSVLALRNLRSRRIRWIQPVSMQTTQTVRTIQTMQTMKKEKHKSKRNVQLIRLSLLQVLIFTLLNAPWIAYATFAHMARVESFGFLNYILMNSFLNSIGLVSLYVYGSVTFIIYALAAKTFRTECKMACLQWWNKVKGWH